jgi:HlyD family secretion protein
MGQTVAFRPVTVKLGISDGSNTEVLDGLGEGDEVATGFLTATTTPASTGGGPLGNPFSRGGRPR